MEERLSGGNVNAVFRRGTNVVRGTGPWSPSVHRLLGHLESKGFGESPRFVGLEPDGRETLTFLPGEVGFRDTDFKSVVALDAAARLLRRYHDAASDFDLETAEGFAYRHPDRTRWETIVHNDFAPYNLVRADGIPAGLIDFDNAGPGPRLRDIAFAVYWFAPLSFGDSNLMAFANDELASGCPRVNRFCEVYGIAPSHDLLDGVAGWLAEIRDWMLTGATLGDANRLRLIDEGHLTRWIADGEAFDANRDAIARALGL